MFVCLWNAPGSFLEHLELLGLSAARAAKCCLESPEDEFGSEEGKMIDSSNVTLDCTQII